MVLGQAGGLSEAPAWQRFSVSERIEALLERIAQADSDIYRCAFIDLDPAKLRAQAESADLRRANGRILGPLDGCLIAVKDLFDVAGETTSAGSAILHGAEPAPNDCAVIARLRAAGAVLVGRTNMSEFAFSGIGLNPHFGTPANPLDPTRVPGGSTSGGAVAVALDWVDAAIGTDTSGSVRIPAAFCGLAAWKPTWGRIPTSGVFPLATSLDSVGVISRSIVTCSHIDAVASGEHSNLTPWESPSLKGMNIGVVGGALMERTAPEVAAAFSNAVAAMRRAGANLRPVDLRSATQLLPFIEQGGFVTIEAYRLHRERLTAHGDLFDQLVRRRMERGASWSDSQWSNAISARLSAVVETDLIMADMDALLLPTTPEWAPLLSSVGDANGFSRHNSASIHHTMWANILQLCSSVIPICNTRGEPPGSLMLFSRASSDIRLLALTRAIEREMSYAMAKASQPGVCSR